MKRILSIIATGLSLVSLAVETDVEVVTVENHKYVVASTLNSNGGVAIVHAESCQCKNPKTEEELRREIQGPRLFSKSMRTKKYEEQKGICPHCTNHFEFSEMQGDHIVPYSLGGPTAYTNLQMLCIRCNQKKGNRYSH